MQVYVQHTRNKGRGNYVFRRDILIIYGFGSKNHLEKLCSNLFVAFFPQSATSAFYKVKPYQAESSVAVNTSVPPF